MVLIFLIVLLERFFIYGTLRDLVLFVQFKKREKRPWSSVDFSKVAGFSMSARIMLSIHWVYSSLDSMFSFGALSIQIKMCGLPLA